MHFNLGVRAIHEVSVLVAITFHHERVLVKHEQAVARQSGIWCPCGHPLSDLVFEGSSNMRASYQARASSSAPASTRSGVVKPSVYVP